jgi:hypothetical protein
MKTGQQQRIPATRSGEKQKQRIFGGYDWLNDMVIRPQPTLRTALPL